jgi:hypothetical protein
MTMSRVNPFASVTSNCRTLASASSTQSFTLLNGTDSDFGVSESTCDGRPPMVAEAVPVTL